MHLRIRTVTAAVGVACLATALTAVSGSIVLAQTSPPANQAAPAAAPTAAEPAMKEITLTEKQIQGVLAAHKDVDAIAAKMPDDPNGKPDPKVLKQLDDAAKKHGFADYAEYGDVIEAISMVLAGMDAKTKKYVGTEAGLKQQIAELQADTKISAEDKKQALQELNEALKNPGPSVTNQTNIDLVTKHYDALADALDEDE